MSTENSSVYVGLLQRLLDHDATWGARDVTAQSGVRPEVLPLLYGLRSHSCVLAEATMAMWGRSGLRVAVGPLVRAVYEVGLTAQWVSQVPYAAEGVVAAYAKQRTKLVNQMEKIPGPLATRAPSDRDKIPEVSSPRLNIALRVEEIAKQFTNSDELYVYYRILCGQTHAGVEVADSWLSLGDGGQLQLLAQPSPRPALEAPLAVFGLLLAASAFEHVLQPPSRDVSIFLDEIAEELGMPKCLDLKIQERNSHDAGTRP